MVVGTRHDARRKDRRRALADIPAGRSGDAKGFRWSPGLLADVTVRQLRFVRAKKRDIGIVSDAVRNRRRGCNWNASRVGEGIRSTGPYFTGADAPGRQ